MIKKYLFLLGVGLIWGSQFIFQDRALGDLPPVWIGAGRAMIGFVTLYVLCRILGLTGGRRQWGLFALIGLLEAAIPFVLIPWGQQYLDSAIAALLIGTLPFFVVLLSPLFIRGAALTRAGLGSALIGFAGLVILFYPQLAGGADEVDPRGAAAIILAAGCFAVALLLLKRLHAEHPLIVARNVLAMASLQLLAIALMTAPVSDISLAPSGVGAILYLGVICAGLVYYLYMALIREAGPVFTSLTNYIVPAIGVLIGTTLNDETLTPNVWLALLVILAALAGNQLLDRPARVKRPAGTDSP